MLRHMCNWELENNPVFRVAGAQPHVKECREKIQAHLPHFASEDFKWIHAADYFMCAEGHGQDIPAELVPYRTTAITHTLWRFSTLFEPLAMRSLAAAGLLADILKNMEASMGVGLDDDSGPAATTPHFCLFSGHDITVLPLLQCLTARRLTQWPPYASNVRFELHKIASHQEADGPEAGYRVRVLYNGQPVWVAVPGRQPGHVDAAVRDRSMLTMAEFRAVVAVHMEVMGRVIRAPPMHIAEMVAAEESAAHSHVSHDDAA